MNLIQSYDDSDEEDERPLKKARIEYEDKIETILVTQKVLNEMLDAPPTLPFESITSDEGSSWYGYIYLRVNFTTEQIEQLRSMLKADVLDTPTLHKFDTLFEDPVLGYHISCCYSFPLKFAEKKPILSKLYNWMNKTDLSEKAIQFDNVSVYCNQDRFQYYLALDCTDSLNSLPHFIHKHLGKLLNQTFTDFKMHLSISTATELDDIIPKNQTWKRLGSVPPQIFDWCLNVDSSTLYCKIGSTKLYKFHKSSS